MLNSPAVIHRGMNPRADGMRGKGLEADDCSQLPANNSDIPMDEKELKLWWQSYLKEVTSSEKKGCGKANEMLVRLHQNFPQQLLDLVDTCVVMPLKKHDCVGEVEFRALSAILESPGLGRDALWTLRTSIYDHLLALATRTLRMLDLGNNRVQAKLHACIRCVLKMEQCHFHNWTVERKDKPSGELERCIGLVLVSVVSSDNCESESRLLAGTAFAFFLHSFCDSAKSLELFLSAFPLTAELNGIRNMFEKFGNLNVNDFEPGVEITDCSSSVFLLHGLLTCGKTSILSDTFSSSGKPLAAAFIPLLVDLCNCPNQNAYHAFGTLVACLKFLLKNMEELRRGSKHGDSTLVLDRTAVISLVDTLNFNWSSPIVGVKSLAREAFELILEIHCAEVKPLSVIQSHVGFSIDELCNQVMSQPWTAKSKYPPLAILVRYVGLRKLLSMHPSIVDDLAESLSSNSVSSVGCEVYRSLLQQLRKENEGMEDVDLTQLWQETFLKPLLSALYQNNRISYRNAIRHMLAPTLKLFPLSFHKIWFHVSQDGRPLALSVTVLRLSRAYGIHSLNDTDFQLLKRCLNNSDEAIREEAFATICSCSKKAEPLSSTEMDLLKDFVALNLNVDCASFRQQLVFNFKALLVRLRNSCLSWLSSDKKKGSILRERGLLFYSMDFLDHLFRLILRNLSPGGCYQRRHTCLLLLKSLMETFCTNDLSGCRRKGVVPAKTPALLKYFEDNEKCDFLSSKTRYVLLVCIMDYMDEIKDLASYLLNNYVDRELSSQEGTEKYLLSLALRLCRSPKTTCCQSGARFFHYLFSRAEVSRRLYLIRLLRTELLKHLTSAREDFLEASKNAPMHGLLSALTLLFGDGHLFTNDGSIGDSLKATTSECIRAACDIVTHILNVLGVHADEAKAPSFEDMGEAIDDIVTSSRTGGDDSKPDFRNSVEHQLIQSCCWLSLKEGCLFLGTVVGSLPLEGSSAKDTFLVSHEDVERAGDALVSVLLTCRHRGAIESCSVGFQLFCEALTESGEATYISIVRAVLSDALKDVAGLATLTSVTRRSAGLPLLIQTVASSQPSKFLPEAMRSLLKLAEEPLPTVLNDAVDLPNARALHVLRALIHDSRLSRDVLPFLNEVVVACLGSFTSPSWAVRNAGLQLFGGLIPRLLGQKKVSEDESGHNRIPCDEFFAKWPKLWEFLIGELEQADPDDLRPTVLPVLSLLGHLAPATGTGDAAAAVGQTESSALVRAIRPLLACPVWHVRKMAARDVAALLTDDLKVRCFRDVYKSLTANGENANLAHGRLLLLKALLENMDAASLGAKDLEGLVDVFGNVPAFAACPILRAAAMDVLSARPFSSLPATWLDLSPGYLSYEPGRSLWLQKLTYWRLARCPKDDVLSLVEGLLDGGSNEDEFEAVAKYLRDAFDDGSFSDSFWKRVQNLLCPCLARIRLPALLLTFQQLMSDACLRRDVFPDAVHIRSMLALSERMANGDYGTSVRAVSVVLRAIVGRVQSSETLPEKRLEDCIDPWTSLVLAHSSPRMPEIFRLSAAKALRLCGVQLLESVELDSALWSPNVGSCISRTFDATLLLLQDEQVDVRKETSKFVSVLTESALDRKVESLHSSLAIERSCSYFVKRFHSLKEFGNLVWEKLSCESQLESAVLEWAEESSRAIVLFEQEDVNVHAEKCFMTRCYVDILKGLLEKDAEILRQTFDRRCVAEVLSAAHLVTLWLESERKPAIGVLEIVTRTKIAPHLCNLCARLEVLQIHSERESDEQSLPSRALEKLRDIIGLTW